MFKVSSYLPVKETMSRDLHVNVGYNNMQTEIFLIDVPFIGCQGCSNRSSIMHAYQKFRFSSRIRIFMQKSCSPLISGPGQIFNLKKKDRIS
jgi:hypothetical protein